MATQRFCLHRAKASLVKAAAPMPAAPPPQQDNKPTLLSRAMGTLPYLGGGTMGGVVGHEIGSDVSDKIMSKAPSLAEARRNAFNAYKQQPGFLSQDPAKLEQALVAHPQVRAAQKSHGDLALKALRAKGLRTGAGVLGGLASVAGLSHLLGYGSPFSSPTKQAGVVSDTVGSVPGLGWMQTDNVGHPFAKALQEVAEGQMKQDAMGDIGNIGLAGLGVGAGAAGVAGLARLFKKKKNRTTNPVLPLPFPVEPSQMPERFISKKADITTRAALPWYGPAMMASGMGGMALGWGGIDSVLKAKAKKDREAELEAARSEFHDAMLSQYDKPLKAPAKTAGDDELGRELDRLFDLTQQALEKKAMNMADAGGMALGGYGMYAGLTGLLTGSVVYNQMKKRSRAAILEKAMQKRERRKFMQSPPEIYAVPEPMSSPLNGPGLSKADARLLKTSPDDLGG